MPLNKTDKDFFVILYTQNGYTPMVDGDDLAKFASVAAAKACAEKNPLGAHFGYGIFERGTGINET